MRNSKAYLSLLLISAALALGGPGIVATASAEDAARAILEGRVVSKAGTPKAFVRVEIDSPEITVFTGSDGVFKRKLASGDYTIKIIEGRRSNEFRVTVPSSGVRNKEFRLSW